MSIKNNNFFRDKIRFSLLYEAYKRAIKQKRFKKEPILYELDLGCNLIQLLKDLLNNRYYVGNYRKFKIYDPKEREIWALPLRDRIVHQWYVEEFIKPIFLPKFINDSYACIEGRGMIDAIKKLQKYMKNMRHINPGYYILKCDISKYFYNIDKDVLLSIICKKVKDKEFIAFTKKLLYENSPNKIGIPIGNYTSQYFANIYLNELDHFVKEKLRIKYYVRYMDDFVLLLNSQEESKKVKNNIEKFLNEKLKLKFNNKTNYTKNKNGVKFCGFHIYNNYINLGNRNKKAICKRVKKWNEMYESKTIDLKSTIVSFRSWEAHANLESGHRIIKSVVIKSKWICKECS